MDEGLCLIVNEKVPESGKNTAKSPYGADIFHSHLIHSISILLS